MKTRVQKNPASGRNPGRSQEAKDKGEADKAMAAVTPASSSKRKADEFAEGEEPAADEASGKNQRCKGHCGKLLEVKLFNKDQKKCKVCVNDVKRFGRVLKDQGESEWFEELQANQPKSAQSVLRKYSKHYKDHNKGVNFSVMQVKKKIIKRHSHSKAGRYKKMWQDEFIDQMQKVEHGKYTESEARRMWDEMKQEAGQGKRWTDKNGPRGTQRFKVFIGDFESSGSSMETESELELGGTVKKKPNAADIDAEAANFMGSKLGACLTKGDSDGDDHASQLKSLRNRGLENQRIDVRGLVSSSQTKLTASKIGQSDKAEDSGDEKAKPETEEAAEKADEWFDKDTFLPKAARAMKLQVEKLKADLKLQAENTSAALLEMESAKDIQDALSIEIAVLRNRSKAVVLVSAEGPSASDDLKEYLKQFGPSSSASSVGAKMHSGPPSASMAGPCPGFRNLSTLAYLKEAADALATQKTAETEAINSKEALAAWSDQYEKNFKAIRELLKSITSAFGELYQAKLDHANLAAQTQQARKKAATQREKMLTSDSVKKPAKSTDPHGSASQPSIFAYVPKDLRTNCLRSKEGSRADKEQTCVLTRNGFFPFAEYLRW